MARNKPAKSSTNWREPLYLGVDVGGTFSDFFLVEKGGRSAAFKHFTTPDDPSQGVLEGLRAMGASLGFAERDFIRRIHRIVHGTTIATNALITGRTAKTGFLTTAGFRDIANMRRGLRPSPFDGKLRPPPLLVPRHLIAEVDERVDCEGAVVRELDRHSVKAAVERLLAEGVQSIAVSLLFSFLNPAHEKIVAEIVRDAAKKTYLSISHEVLPQIGAYERHCTTIINAKVGPVIDGYLENLSTALARDGFGGELYIMQSNGGVGSLDSIRRTPVNTLLSGPAAGPTAAGVFSGKHPGVLVGDMGGTSFEVSLIQRGVVSLTNEREVGGYRVATPGLRIHSIGAGGGSIAWAEEGKILRVGPASAGALPGPACYGKGGNTATVTDAQLVLGYLNPGAFLGGRFRLNPDLAASAVRAVGEPLGLSVEETAAGIYRIVNANMAGAIRVVTIQEGIDPRDHLLVMGGGAGPIHAAEIAAELGIRDVLIPRVGAVMCAYGMLMADFHHHFVRSLIRPLRNGIEAQIRRALDEMTKEARNRSAAGHLSLRPTLDVRYAGQFHEVEIPLADLDAKKITAAFHARHEGLYGYADLSGEVELVNVHLYSIAGTKKPARIRIGKDGGVKKSFKETRKIFFTGKFVAAAVYDGAMLGAGARLQGPCVVEYPDTAVVVQPYCRALLDGSGNFRLALNL